MNPGGVVLEQLPLKDSHTVGGENLVHLFQGLLFLLGVFGVGVVHQHGKVFRLVAFQPHGLCHGGPCVLGKPVLSVAYDLEVDWAAKTRRLGEIPPRKTGELFLFTIVVQYVPAVILVIVDGFHDI